MDQIDITPDKRNASLGYRISKYTMLYMALIIGFAILPHAVLGLEINDEEGRIKRAISADPTNVSLRLELSRYYIKQYNSTKDSSYLDKVIFDTIETLRIEPTRMEAHLDAMYALNFLPASKISEKHLEQLKGFQAKALKTNQDLVSLDGFVPYQFFIGWLYYVRGFKNKESLDKAAAELKESVRLQPALPSSHRVLGAVYRSQGKNDLAIFELKEAIRLDPYSAKNHKELAIVYRNGVFSSDGCLDLSIVEPGIRSIKEAVRLDPNDAYSHFLLGWFFTLTGNFDLGIFEYKTATDLDNQSQYREKIAMAYLLKGDVDIALDRLLVTLEEKSSQEAIGNLLYDLSFAYLILNRFDEARVKAYSAVSNRVSKPAYAKIINYLALQQLQKKSEAQALLLAHTRQNKPGSWEYDIVQYYLGIINEEKLLGKVSNPCKKTEAYFYIGYNYLINENREKAMSCFRIACDEKIYGFSEYAGACIKLRELEQANASK